MSGYPVAELIDRERLMEVLERSVVRAREARREERVARGCFCWQAGEMCDPCWNS